mgnify:FL=1
MIKEGQKAPNFNLPNQNGKDISLSDFLGKKVVLWFFPKANTPGWTTEGQGFRDELEYFNNKDISIIGMSADSVQKQKNFCDKQNFSYPILADETKETLKAYGAWGVKKMYGREYEGIIRCSFLINEEGIVEKVYDKVKTKSHAKDILSDIG